MFNDYFWNMFSQSGSIDAYLAYRDEAYLSSLNTDKAYTNNIEDDYTQTNGMDNNINLY